MINGEREEYWNEKTVAALGSANSGVHLGEDKTFQMLKLSYYWPGYWNPVKE